MRCSITSGCKGTSVTPKQGTNGSVTFKLAQFAGPVGQAATGAVQAKEPPKTWFNHNPANDWAIKEAHDALDKWGADPRSKDIVSNLGRAWSPSDGLSFFGGVLEGFLIDGIWGDLVGIKDLASIGVRAGIQSSEYVPGISWMNLPGIYKEVFGEEPLAQEFRSLQQITGALQKTSPQLANFATQFAYNSVDILDAIARKEYHRLEKYGPMMMDVAIYGGDLLLDIAKELSAISPETAGRVTGWALYQIALTFATAGAGHLIKVSKAGTMCRALTAIKAGDLLADYPKVAVIVEKAMVAMTKLMNVACFVRGTPVHSRAGIVPIESVKKGDWLLARHEREPDSANAYRQVLEVFVNHTDEVLHIAYESARGRETLTATAGHPIFSVSKNRFVEAEQLAVGDLLRLADDSSAMVVSIEREHAVAGQAITTYNFAVEEFRTFFVGQAAVWVHNDCPFELKPLLEKVLRNVDGAVDEFVEKAADLIQRTDNRLDKQQLLDGLDKEPIPKQQLDEIKAKLAKRLENAAPNNVLGHINVKPPTPAGWKDHAARLYGDLKTRYADIIPVTWKQSTANAPELTAKAYQQLIDKGILKYVGDFAYNEALPFKVKVYLDGDFAYVFRETGELMTRMKRGDGNWNRVLGEQF